MCAVNRTATGTVFASQPSWYFLTPHTYKKFTHILGVGLGFRSLLADFEYISFLQYYGDGANHAGNYKDLYRYIDDMTDADPHFEFAYTYGAAILAFNLSRYDEAVAIIKKGLDYNPAFWRLRLYLAAIAYKSKGDKTQYIGFLEDALKYKDHPAMLDRLLGNIYEQYRTPDECAAYWLTVYRKTRDKYTKDFADERLMFFIKGGKLKDPDKLLRQMR
jgi:tetratricopeptide (TPR) repeat protein